jgi:hypothetical protein
VLLRVEIRGFQINALATWALTAPTSNKQDGRQSSCGVLWTLQSMSVRRLLSLT